MLENHLKIWKTRPEMLFGVTVRLVITVDLDRITSINTHFSRLSRTLYSYSKNTHRQEWYFLQKNTFRRIFVCRESRYPVEIYVIGQRKKKKWKKFTFNHVYTRRIEIIQIKRCGFRLARGRYFIKRPRPSIMKFCRNSITMHIIS